VYAEQKKGIINCWQSIKRKKIKINPVNIDQATVEGFGQEWKCFNQQGLSDCELKKIFSDYFHLFPWEVLPPKSEGADIGCGSGRWAKFVVSRVGILHLVDASPLALEVARENLKMESNVLFHLASVDTLPFENCTLDFAYSLGVLHHVPDTAGAIRDIVLKLKLGAPLLLYLYYRFDNRGVGFRALWKISDWLRGLISNSPFPIRYAASQILALFVYLPLARVAQGLAVCRILPRGWPLAYYRDKPWYVLRTDALDRFGTKLEKRFTRDEIKSIMSNAGLENIHFSEREPYWCVIGYKKAD